MGILLNIADFKKRGESPSVLQSTPHLACPHCDALCAPVLVEANDTVLYRCRGNGHRAIHWRIDREGNMFAGKTGRREFALKNI